MAEPPERRALKSLLIKFKARSITSEDSFKDSWKGLAQYLGKIFELAQKSIEQNPENKDLSSFMQYFTMEASLIGAHHTVVTSAIEDLKLYVTALRILTKSLMTHLIRQSMNLQENKPKQRLKNKKSHARKQNQSSTVSYRKVG